MPNLVPYSFTALIDTDTGGDNIVAAQAVSVKFDYDGTLATIYSDAAGTSPISQPGAVTDSNGVLAFWVEAGRYQIESGSRTEYVVIDDGSMLKLTESEVGTSKHLREGDIVPITDRGNSLWNVIASTGTENGYDSLAGTGSGVTLQLDYGRELNVLWFGAKGNGVADDAGPIQRATDLGGLNPKWAASTGGGGRTVIFPEGSYRVTVPIQIPNFSTAWKGPVTPRFSAIAEVWIDDVTATSLIETEDTDFVCDKLKLIGPDRASGKYVVLDTSSRQTADRDHKFNECVFENAGRAMKVNGRGLYIIDCDFQILDGGIEMGWPSPFTAGTDPDQTLEGGYRAVFIQGGRLHAMTGYLLYSESTNAVNLNGVHVSDVKSDTFVGAFKGSGVNLTFSDLNFIQANNITMYDFFTVDNVRIDGGSYSGSNDGRIDVGSHDGANNASVLTDSTQTWVTNELVGNVVYNKTDGSYATITANTATTVTATLAGGTDNDWDTSDEYVIAVEPSWPLTRFIRLNSGETASNISVDGVTVKDCGIDNIILLGTWSNISITDSFFLNALYKNNDTASTVYGIVKPFSGGSGFRFDDNTVETGDYRKNNAIIVKDAIAGSALTSWSIRGTMFDDTVINETDWDQTFDFNRDVYTTVYLGNGTDPQVFNLASPPKAAIVSCRTGANQGETFMNVINTTDPAGRLQVKASSVEVRGIFNTNTEEFSLTIIR